MAGVRLSMLKSLRKSTLFSLNLQSFQSYTSYWKIVNYTDPGHIRPAYAFVNRSYHSKETQSHKTFARAHSRALGSVSFVNIQSYTTKPISAFSSTLSSTQIRGATPLALINPIFSSRSYSSFFGSNADKTGEPGLGVPAASGGSEVDVGNSGIVGSDWVGKFKDAWQSALDAATFTGQKAKETSTELSPYIQQLLDSNPHLRNVVVPIGCTLLGTIFAWFVMPRLFRRFHNYGNQGRAALLSASPSEEQVPYEKSFWGALEDPVRYLVTFMAFSQMLVVPTSRVATAFAARDILGNVLSGLSMQFSKPFSLGDTIKNCAIITSIEHLLVGPWVATLYSDLNPTLNRTTLAGSIEGQVVEMGITTTCLLNAEKFPVIVPNSLFSSQVIVNKSRAQWRAIVTKIPLQINDLDKIPQISTDIKSMLRSHSKVFLGKEAPYCFLSRLESSFAELTLGCNLKHMSKGELYSTEEEIILRSAQIIKEHGAKLGSTYQI
ncbi:hypothetical protein DVH24_014223 [Malus domestica]|uniref:Mechanosensitive ion channel MscS domain-containing protein n=1 Tax=Malus domestica TaxID=3750 RepID=A0A498JFS0_MALDO|nr:hypothetical protein DVH24_014223 [Malus domestica]